MPKKHNKHFAVEPESHENDHRKQLPTDEEMNLIVIKMFEHSQKIWHLATKT